MFKCDKLHKIAVDIVAI